MTAPGSDDEKHSTDETLPMPSGQGLESPIQGEDADPPAQKLTPQEPDHSDLTPEQLDALDTPVGQILAERYKILDRLGSGGMAIVYRARHQTLRTTVAVKVLKRRLAADRVSVTRFHREAMAAASVGNPHIVHIIDYGFTTSGDAFIVMEYLEGSSLRQVVRSEGPLAMGRAVSLCRQILRGLEAAHGQGIVHRDLKGDNVFVTCQGGRDFVKLLDFGISKVAFAGEDKQSTGLTSTGVVMGTPQYIAPEQASGLDEVDQRADIYALGVILYEMLTGVLPFDGRTPLEILMKHVQEVPVPPSKRRPELGIPPELDAVVLKALAKDPADRYASAVEMKAALPEGSILPGGFASGPLPSAAAAARRGRWTLPFMVGGGAIILIGAVSLLLTLRRGDPRLVRVDPVPAPALVLEPDLGQPAPPPPTPTAVKAATVELEVSAQPHQARIFRDGKPLGVGSVKIKVPRGDQPLALDVRAPGFQRMALPLVPDQDRQVEVVLEPLKAKRPKPKTKTKKVKEVRDNPYQR